MRLALGFLGVLAVVGALTLVPALAARDRLEEARAAMERGREALVEGRVGESMTAFARAESAFAAARGETRNPLMRLASYLPLLGRTPDAVGALAEAGTLVARAARVAASALEELPGGLGDLAPRGGAIPLDPLTRMAPTLAGARELSTRAEDVLGAAPSSWLLGPVAEARAEFGAQLERSNRALEAAAALSRELPRFLGAAGERRYFFGAQNPAELRGTGGLIGAYSILTVDDGRLRFGPFDQIQDLPNIDEDEVLPPSDSFAARYDRFGGAGFWLNINVTPDFPSAAVAIERLYGEVAGEELDGVIVADPFALEALLHVTGPVEVRGIRTAITANTAVRLLTNEAYSRFSDPVTRKRVLGDAAKAIFERFLTRTAGDDPATAARTLIQVAADGHLLAHSTELAVQRALTAVGVAGELRNPEGDYLGVFATNAAGNKADYYLERSVRYQVNLGAEGSAAATASVGLTNEAPSTGQPPAVIGPFEAGFEPGENRTYLSIYSTGESLLESFREERAAAEGVGSGEELGHRVFDTFVGLDSGGSATLEYTWTLPGVWEGDDGSGTYTLTVQGQNGIRPAHLVVDIRAPKGMSIVRSEPGMQVNGNRAVWEGEIGSLARFEVSFERPLAERIWRALVRFLNRPVITL